MLNSDFQIELEECAPQNRSTGDMTPNPKENNELTWPLPGCQAFYRTMSTQFGV